MEGLSDGLYRERPVQATYGTNNREYLTMARGKPRILTDIKNKQIDSTPIPAKDNKKKALRELIARKTPIAVTDLFDVKLLIAKMLLQVQKDEVDSGKARTIVWICSQYVQCHNVESLEVRMVELEKRLSI